VVSVVVGAGAEVSVSTLDVIVVSGFSSFTTVTEEFEGGGAVDEEVLEAEDGLFLKRG